MSDTDYDPSCISNSSSHVRAAVLSLLFVLDFFIFFHVSYTLRPDRETYLSLPFKFVLSVRMSNSLWGSDVLLFL